MANDVDPFADLIAKAQTATAQPAVQASSDDPFADLIANVPQARSAELHQPKLSPLDQAADARVAKEAAGGLVPQPSVAAGLPFGSWLDEASAGLDAGLNKVTGGYVGQPYDEALAYQHARQRYIDQNNPTAQALSTAAGAIATAPLAPAARVMQGTALVPRMVNAAVNGGFYGALYGSGEGDTADEKLANAGKGFGLGAVLGGALPPLESGISNAYAGVRDRLTALPQELSGFGKNAVNRVTSLANMDELTPQMYQTEAARLGPEGTLADMGPNLRMATEGIAQQPGPQRRIIENSLNPRDEAAPGRIAQDINTNMGAPVNVPQTVQAIEQHYGAQAGPLYRQFYQTAVPQTPEIGQITSLLQRTDPAILREAGNLAVRDGVDPRFLTNLVSDPMSAMTGVQRTAQGPRVWQGVELDYLKRGLDDAARAAKPGSNANRIYSGLARRLRTSVDTAISPQDPAQSIWARARAIAGDGITANEALEEGQNAFRNNLSADQLAFDQQGRTAEQRAAYQLGARESLRSKMDSAATNFGPNGDAVARRLLNAPENQAKMETIIGAQPAAAIQRRIAAENQMAETQAQVFGNSATARRQAIRDLVPRQYDAATYKAMESKNLEGFVLGKFHQMLNLFTAGHLNARNTRIAEEMANMLVAQGMRRDQIARGLLGYAARQNITQTQRRGIEAFIRTLGNAARPLAIGAVTAPATSDK